MRTNRKYLLKIEFRYYDTLKIENEYTSKSKMITIGVYDTFKKACENGNNLLKVLESKFELHMFPNGSKAKKERFSENGGYLGSEKNLVTNLAYLKTPFAFYATIETLEYSPIDEVIENIISTSKRHINYKIALE